MDLVIRGGRVVDPANGLDRVADVYVRDGRIVPPDKVPADADVSIDAAGLVVVPGLVDMHVHLR